MIVAGFPSRDALLAALDRLRDAGIPVETRTPAALPEPSGSPLPRAAAIAGLAGAAAGFGMQCYATMAGYRMLIGGRPDFFWTSYLVYAFECGVLAAMLTCFVGFFIACRMPALYEPEDESEALRAATRDGWFLLLRRPDQRGRAALREMRASVEEVRE